MSLNGSSLNIRLVNGRKPRSLYDQRIVEKLHATNRWENQPVSRGVTITDLDEDEIYRTVDNAVDLGRLEPLKRRTTKEILAGLGLIVGGKLLNAAVALYGKTQRLQALYPQCAIHLARFRGKHDWATSSTIGSIGETLSPRSAVQKRSCCLLWKLACWNARFQTNRQVASNDID